MEDSKTEVSAQWGGGREGAGRPKMTEREKRVPVSLSISRSLRAAIQRDADRKGISFSRAAENRLKS